MKKWLQLLLVLVLAFVMCSCGGNQNIEPLPKPIPSSTPDIADDENERNDSIELIMLRQSMIETSYTAAVAYLGMFDGEYDDLEVQLDALGITEDYPYLLEVQEDHFVNFDGQELYLIVPRDVDAEITIYEWIIDEYNDYLPEEGEVVFSCVGEPVLVRGNMSEIVPNFMVEIISEDGMRLQYTPCLSGVDGSLETPYEEPFVKDITPYDFLNMGSVQDEFFDESVLWMYSSWDTEIYTVDDEYLQLSLSFYEDGFVECCYGLSGEMMKVYYSGTYMRSYGESGDTFILELSLDINDSQNDVPESIVSEVVISWYEDGYALVLTYVDGDRLSEKEQDIQHLFFPSFG